MGTRNLFVNAAGYRIACGSGNGVVGGTSVPSGRQHF